MLSTFAGIGLKMLVPALNLRRNSKEYRPVHKLDEAASGCFSCPYYNIQQSKCESCEHKQYYSVTQTVYRNEKNNDVPWGGGAAGHAADMACRSGGGHDDAKD